ncbi:hypothetical protein E4H12_12900 [Candidatus Thorarchaeota archaeon]|nr:MAG: hypothetical protein E4H12_12900 [Candidatus Thorarchaeota archaeon]HUW47662.1 hypothetical protein [Patescibacteria group bacterium]
MSVDIGDSVSYGVIINTDSYAGNFEREMTAYCTGRYGECGVGENLVYLFNGDFGIDEQDCEEDPFWDSIDYRSDEHGCGRPCSIYSDENDGYNSVIIFFKDAPTKKQLAIIYERAIAFSEDPRAITERGVHGSRGKNITINDVKAIKIETKVSLYLPE